MPNVKGWELVLILALVLLLFGAKRLPDAARGLGRSLRIFKAETKGLRDDDAPAETGYSDTTGPRVETRRIETTEIVDPPRAPERDPGRVHEVRDVTDR
jgi:sec-independent protein translocase protein TatA